MDIIMPLAVNFQLLIEKESIFFCLSWNYFSTLVPWVSSSTMGEAEKFYPLFLSHAWFPHHLLFSKLKNPRFSSLSL